MNREYHKWHSACLAREMELLVFGHSGRPVLVFPTSMGRFWDFEDRGMIAALAPAIEAGALQAFCLDSVDAESWYATRSAPRSRVMRHEQYEAYVIEEAIPFARQRSTALRVSVAGCSFGGYHAINFALRHPEYVDLALSMGGAFDIRQFLDGYFDEICHRNCPPDFVPGLERERLDQCHDHVSLILATGEADICLGENVCLSRILHERGVRHELDIQGSGAAHDWPWWQQMARKYLP
ncbi:MAG: alpha/beta hydrolase-fold protein [Bryobacteraceae bacterium]